MVENEQKKLKNLIMLISEIAEIKDFDVLMEKILKSAREFVNCDAGSIFIKKEDTLLFSYAQNDTLSKRLKPGQKLLYTTFLLPINDRSIAGHVALTGETLNIGDAYSLPKSLSYTFNKQYDERAQYKTRSILTIPMKTSSGKIIGILQLINKMNEKVEVISFDPDELPYVNSFANIVAGALERAQLMRMVIMRMIRMAELRDPKETGNHVNRVAAYSVEIYETWAKTRGVSQDEIHKNVDVLRMAAMLHDVGKVAISDTILKKPARLDEEEYEIMKQHTILGAKLFDDTISAFGETARLVALNHHERYDGMGYPGHIDAITGNPLPDHLDDNGKPIPKKGEEIPLFGRIVAFADVYDALSSARVYKEAWDEKRVLSVIHEEQGKHFDPEIVDAFFICIDTIRSITERYAG
ncbi:HD domain-containing phosphohydrolase [Candidatus Latescibacterota bacterium]